MMFVYHVPSIVLDLLICREWSVFTYMTASSSKESAGVPLFCKHTVVC